MKAQDLPTWRDFTISISLPSCLFVSSNDMGNVPWWISTATLLPNFSWQKSTGQLKSLQMTLWFWQRAWRNFFEEQTPLLSQFFTCFKTDFIFLQLPLNWQESSLQILACESDLNAFCIRLLWMTFIFIHFSSILILVLSQFGTGQFSWSRTWHASECCNERRCSNH